MDLPEEMQNAIHYLFMPRDLTGCKPANRLKTGRTLLLYMRDDPLIIMTYILLALNDLRRELYTGLLLTDGVTAFLHSLSSLASRKVLEGQRHVPSNAKMMEGD